MRFLKRVTSAGLALLLSVSAFPSTAFAASDSTSTLTKVTAKFIDAENGKEIIQPETYSVTHEEKSPQEIENYIYVDYTESVEYVYSHKDLSYIVGYPDESVRSDAPMTRAEAATVFYRLYDGEYPEFERRMSNGTFEDVKTDYWFYKEVETLYNIGIVDGTEENKFSPDAPVTRAEFAVMAARFANLDYKGGNIFDDVPNGHWAYSYINAAANAGWVEGYPDGSFRPDEPISRAEVVRLVNGMINRNVTLDKLKELDVECPYNDLVENHWGYCDLMEATIPHSAEEWHGLSYNDGNYNIIIEKFVDQNGKELVESVITAGKEETSPKAIPAYEYRGYIRTITYHYTNGDAIPSIEKTANVKAANVGDTLTYTVKLKNDEAASSAWKEVVLTDELPNGLTFVGGSVYADNKAAQHSFENGLLSVPLGDIAAGQTVSVTFKATVNSDMYNQTIYNTAIAEGTNGIVKDEDGYETGKYEDTDDGVYINKGDTMPYVTKTASSSEALVGDKITYTVTLGNTEGAVYEIENAVMTDVIPAELDFEDGSVQVDGVTTEYSFDSETATLTVLLGELAPNTTKTVTFAATVNESAYGKTVYNTAVMTGDNIPDTEGTDEGVSVGDGKARPSIAKKADKSSAKVGDKITYTLTLSNSETATVPVENAVVTDVIPAGLTFEYGSVMLDGSTTSDYTYDENTRLLTVNVGSIEPDASRTVSFVTTVNEDAYNTTIQNLATLTSDNTEPVQDKDNGVVVADGMTDLSINKSVNKSSARVGDTLTYTVEVSNGAGAEVNIRDAVMQDTIPDGLTFRGNVTVDGYSAAYQYDNENRTLSVPLDAIAPGQTKTVCFDVLVNSDAYSMTIENTAIASGSNTPDAEDTDDGVTIEDGTPDGHAGAKSANKTTAHVGDTITYTITLQNGAMATADWTGATVTDVLPDGVTFVGNVQKNRQATTEYSYDSTSRTLTLIPSEIQPGEQVSYTFDVTVDEGMQGKYIVNTAILADGDDQTPLPDAGVQIDGGKADPIISKSASVSEANVGDTFTYEITVKNGDRATAPWKNVMAYDTLPAGVKLIGNVYLDGKVALHKLNGNALSVMVGDLAAGESVTVSFDVQVLDTAAGTILQNSVDVTGDNGSGTATDGGVTVPEVEPQNPTNPTGFYVTKDVDKTVVNVSKDVSNGLKTVTFTIVVGNNSSETWTNVVLKDMLDTSMLTPILQNNVYVDGVLNNDWSFAGKVFSLELGDIEPSQFRTVVLAVQFKADAGGMTYVNYATGEGDNGNATGKSPEIEIVSVVDDPITDIHYQLYNGYGENMWRPGDRISLQEACTVAYRLISNGGNTWLERGTVTVPDYEFSIPEEAKYFVSIGVLPASVFDTTKMTEDVDYEINYEVSENGYLRIWSTSDQLNTLVKYITGTNAGLSGNVSRLNFAKLICQLTGRDTDPDTSGYSGHIQHYTDSGSSESLITEVSHEHDYMLDADGNEYWI